MLISNNVYWVAMFSRTGYELAEIIKKTKVLPNKIIINKKINSNSISKEILEIIKWYKNIEIVETSKNPTVEEYDQCISSNTSKPIIITLHGWMRILPQEVCQKYTIYNGHPGLITKYPELKGKDPQKRSLEGEYKEIGTVIHEVIPEVDEGRVVASASIENTYNDVDTLSDVVREISILLWVDFLKSKFYE